MARNVNTVARPTGSQRLPVKDKKVGFAVVGLGKIAQVSVLPAFRNCKKARLEAVVSRDSKKAARFARKFKAKSHYQNDEFDACLTNPAVSAVFIATPNGEHAEFTIRAANAGKHVLCEKPLAATAEQSWAMVEACRKNGVLLMTAYRKYFDPSALYLKRLVQNGDLGRIAMIHTAFSELYVPGATQSWLIDARLAGGGPLMDLGVYCVNTCRWILDEDPCEVTAHSWLNDQSRFREVEEGISFQMKFPSGIMLQGSSTYSAALSSFIYLQGSKGWAMLTPAFPFDEERNLTGKVGGRPFSRKFKIIDEFALEIDAFASAIQSKTGIGPDGVQGHRDMIIINAIYEAAKTGKPFRLSY
jgi:predicted dehydrogenase